MAWIDLYSAAGTALATPGPAVNIHGLRYRLELDRLGDFSFAIPALDPVSAYVTDGVQCFVYADDEGLVFKGIVEIAEWDADADGGTVIRVSGRSITIKAIWLRTSANRQFLDVTPASATTTLLAGTGISAGTVLTSVNTFRARMDWITRWEGLSILAETFQAHIRENPHASTLDIATLGTDSGLVFTNAAGLGLDDEGDEPTQVFPLAAVRRVRQSAELVNKIIPYGTGENVERLTLRNSTRTTPYTIQTETGPDGRLVYFIADAASQALYGVREEAIQWKDVVPLSNSTAGVQAAANGVYDLAVTQMLRRKAPQDAWGFAAVGLRHMDPATGSPRLMPGDKVRLDYVGEVVDEDGATVAPLAVNELMYVLSMERAFDDDGGWEWDIVVSPVDRPITDDEDALGEVYDDVHALKTAMRPFPFREIYGPERRTLDSGHSVTFVIDIDANVLYLRQLLLSVDIKAVRVNATGAGTAGASAPTSGPSSASSSSGGGSHGHTINALTLVAGGAHRHKMWLKTNPDFAGDATYGPSSDNTAAWSGAGIETAFIGTVVGSDHKHGVGGVAGHVHGPGLHTHQVKVREITVALDAAGSIVPIYLAGTVSSIGFTDAYTKDTNADHTHTLNTGTAASATDHQHSIPHTHDVTIAGHAHTLTFGIYEGPAPSTPAVRVAVNGVDRTAALGGPFNAAFLAKDLTTYLVDADDQPLRARNTVTFSTLSAELVDLEIVAKGITVVTNAFPV